VVFGWDSSDKCYENIEITGWHTGYPDAQAKIDANTYREIPWENNLPFFMADFSADKKYNDSVCSRSLLKKIIDDSANLGFSPRFAFEYEWFNFKNNPTETYQNNFQNLLPISPEKFGYSVLRTSLNNQYVTDLFDLLEKFDIELEGMHTETGPGVFEAAIRFDEILRAADKAVLFKSAVKEIAYQHNFMATFMAKWNSLLPGCGGHIHQSLWNMDGDKNLFFDEKGKYGMSEIMESYVAGQLFCLPDILPMFAPNVNSYKRIGHGDWAPSTITWGIDNRTAALRIIQGNTSSTRIEMRVPGADANPYLASAASLASGLYGIKNKLKLDNKPTVGSAYNSDEKNLLPGNLFEATQKMANSEIVKQLFGTTFVNHFTKTRLWEWKQFLNGVTDWELKRYFEII
jgi:glutamine synthetase